MKCDKTVIPNDEDDMIKLWAFGSLNETYKGRESRRGQTMDVWVFKVVSIAASYWRLWIGLEGIHN